MEATNHVENEVTITPRDALLKVVSRENPNVLIVEDDRAFWPFWEKVFSIHGAKAHIDWAATEAEAERLIRARFRSARPYDLVIADVFLEGTGTGVDLWNRYGEEVANFIFVSGAPLSTQNLLMSLDFGCPVYLKKPLSAKKCLEVVDDVLELARQGGG